MDIQARLKAMEEWLDLRTRCPWPEQQRYEVLRSVVLFGHSPAERALETGVPRASLYRRVRRFKERRVSVDPNGVRGAGPDAHREHPDRCSARAGGYDRRRSPAMSRSTRRRAS